MLDNVTKIASENNIPCPSDIVISDIKNLLTICNINPLFINPINEGGILLEFEDNKRFYCLEYSNSGEIAFVFRDKSNKRWSYDLTRETFINFISDILMVELKKILAIYKHTLVIDMFQVKRLIDVIEGEEDNYWVYDSISECITKSSCCGQFTPLKGHLPSEEYQRLVNFWNYNTENKAE